MHSARLTILIPPARKAALASRAAALGLSTGEYVRRKVDEEEVSPEEEAELAMLAAELNASVPRMRVAIERSCKLLEELHEENEAFFRDRGIS